MRYLTDPKLFPIIILTLFAMAALRYAWARDWPQAGYWLSAFGLNLAVMAMAKP